MATVGHNGLTLLYVTCSTLHILTITASNRMTTTAMVGPITIQYRRRRGVSICHVCTAKLLSFAPAPSRPEYDTEHMPSCECVAACVFESIQLHYTARSNAPKLGAFARTQSNLWYANPIVVVFAARSRLPSTAAFSRSFVKSARAHRVTATRRASAFNQFRIARLARSIRRVSVSVAYYRHDCTL